jgi:hypothetical protein
MLFFEASVLTLPMRCFTIERFGIKTLWSKQMSSQRTPLSSAAQGAAIGLHQDPSSLFFRAPPKCALRQIVVKSRKGCFPSITVGWD